MRHKIFLIGVMVITMAACAPVQVDLSATATQAATETAAPPTDQLPTPTDTPEPPPTVSDAGSPTPTASPQSGTQFIAYMRDGQLLVTDVSNGVPGGTTQYTVAGQSDKVTDIAWSPSGEFIAFVSAAQGEQHVFYIYALGASSPTDLGPGSAPAWSPDSKSLAYVGGTYPDDNIWMTAIENSAPRPLSFETNHAWGRPAFTPDGQALIVSTADRLYMGAQGNTSFTLERMALDGTGTRTPLPGATSMDGVRLPYDLHFSPDGTHLAFSTSAHFSACASPGAYYVSSIDGGNRQELISPSLKDSIQPDKERYHVGLNYAWSPAGDALLASGTVVDCDANSPTMGQVVAGPQMSLLHLDGSEGLVIPGMYYSISMNRAGTLIAAAHFKDLQDSNPVVELYSAQNGQLVVAVGPGFTPQLQP
jgi:WD40 repeat protein